MNYLRSIWKLEDRFRVIAIIAIAVIVLGLSLVNIADMYAGSPQDRGSGHMQMRM